MTDDGQRDEPRAAEPQVSDDMNDSDRSAAAAGRGPAFKTHSAAATAVPAPDRSRQSTYQGGEFLTEDDWHARRRPESVGGIVDRLMAKVSGGRAAPAALLSARWSEVVGDTFAQKTRPGSCESGRLVILVVDGATASKLRFNTSQIMQKAEEVVGKGKVSSITYRVSPRLRL